MASVGAGQQVTVDKSYFDALLRRADFHTSTQILGRQDPASVAIAKTEYESLLRDSRDFQHLKSALFSGGITPDTLALLISGTAQAEAHKHCAPAVNAWADEFDDQPPTLVKPGPPLLHHQQSYSSVQCKSDDCHDVGDIVGKPGQPPRTLYFTGFNGRTTYRDLLSVIKGGRLLNVSMRSEKSATVTFLDAAADYLAWVKRNDIYLNGKRIEVRWADRQYQLHGHIQNKVDNGATRNIMVRNAVEKGFTEARIREDMEHIHNLVVIDVQLRNGDAYVYTNSVHNALFAKTCMMSRTTYRGCKISFFDDECNVPLPARATFAKFMPQEPSRKGPPLANRFDLLNVDGTNSSSGSSVEENQTPKYFPAAAVHDGKHDEDDGDDDDEAIGFTTRRGVSLQFLDSDSTT